MDNSGITPEQERKRKAGRPWIEPLDKEILCRKRRQLEAMSEAELKSELKHFGVRPMEILEESQDDTGTKMTFEKFKHKWVDLAITAQTLSFSRYPTQSDVIAAEALKKGEGCERVGGGKRKKSKKRKSKRKSKSKKSKKRKAHRKRR